MPTDDKQGSPKGRKPMINEKLVTQIVNALMNGISQRGACDYVGINEDTYYQWIRISQALAMGINHPETPKPPRRRKGDTDAIFNLAKQEYNHQIELLTEFSERVKKARSRVEMALNIAIMDSVKEVVDKDGVVVKPPDGRMALMYLERVFYQDYGKRTLGSDPDGDININIRIKNSEDADGA